MPIKREEIIGDCRLILGDCLEVMPLLGKVDAVVADPPYGNMDTDGGRKLGIHGWDKKINTQKLFDLINGILRKNGPLVLFSQDPYTSNIITNHHNNIPFSYRMTWMKDSFANPLGCNTAPVNYTEDICIFFKNYTKHDFNGFHPLRNYAKKVLDFIGLSLKQINVKLGHRRAEHFFYVGTTQFGLCTLDTYEELNKIFLIDKMGGYMCFDDIHEIDKIYRTDLIEKMTAESPKIFNLPKGKKYKSNVLQYKKESYGDHPTQKPVNIMVDLISTYTDEDNTVLDFTMGSGTTGVACVNLGRKFIGIELEEKYFDIACKRIDQAQRQGKLFQPPKQQPKPQGLF